MSELSQFLMAGGKTFKTVSTGIAGNFAQGNIVVINPTSSQFVIITSIYSDTVSSSYNVNVTSGGVTLFSAIVDTTGTTRVQQVVGSSGQNSVGQIVCGKGEQVIVSNTGNNTYKVKVGWQIMEEV